MSIKAMLVPNFVQPVFFFYFRRSHCFMMSRHRFNKMSRTTGTTSTKITKTARDVVSVFKPRISRRPPLAATEVTTRISMMDFSPKRGCQGGGAAGGTGLSTLFASRSAVEGVGSFSGLVNRHLSLLAGMGDFTGFQSGPSAPSYSGHREFLNYSSSIVDGFV